jgi:hypothetical protein
MVTAATSRSSAPAGGVPPAPVPRRISRPKWLDPRVLIGLLLVVAAVVVGAKVIGSGKQTTPVWAAVHDLAAGTVLEVTDLERAEVNLGDSAGGYLNADQALAGRVLNRAMSAGELVPAHALGDLPTGGRLVAVNVEASGLPPGVTHGSVIDLYLVRGGSGTDATSSTELVGKEVTVQTVRAPSSGGLSGAGGSDYQVVLLLDAKTAQTLVKALPTGTPMITLLTGKPR